MWLLPHRSPAFQWDGARFVDRGTPSCFADLCCGRLIDCAKEPKRCHEKKDCSYDSMDCALRLEWSFLDSTPSSVLLGGYQRTASDTRSLVFARPHTGGWACEQGTEPHMLAGSRGSGDSERAQEWTVDGVRIRLGAPVPIPGSLGFGGYHLTIDGRAVALPADAVYAACDLAPRTLGDLWLWCQDRVWRGDGLTWSSVDTGLGDVSRMWVGTAGQVWALGQAKEGQCDTALVRWDGEDATERRFCVPGAETVVVGGGQFWLLGRGAATDDEGRPVFRMEDETFYFWDGQGLQRTSSPLAFGAAYRSPSGDLWLVGAERGKTKTTDRAKPKLTGVAYRAVAPGGNKP